MKFLNIGHSTFDILQRIEYGDEYGVHNREQKDINDSEKWKGNSCERCFHEFREVSAENVPDVDRRESPCIYTLRYSLRIIPGRKDAPGRELVKRAPRRQNKTRIALLSAR